jgi:putative ABC transport system substrate-binding protein
MAMARAAHAQQPALPVIGSISRGSSDLLGGRLLAFHERLGQTGYLEGRNVAI